MSLHAFKEVVANQYFSRNFFPVKSGSQKHIFEALQEKIKNILAVKYGSLKKNISKLCVHDHSRSWSKIKSNWIKKNPKSMCVSEETRKWSVVTTLWQKAYSIYDSKKKKKDSDFKLHPLKRQSQWVWDKTLSTNFEHI